MAHLTYGFTSPILISALLALAGCGEDSKVNAELQAPAGSAQAEGNGSAYDANGVTLIAGTGGVPEICDGIDNDGDGEIDEGLDCVNEERCAEEYGDDTTHALWLPGVDTNLIFDGPATFTTYTDGTATLTGSAINGSGSGGGFDVALIFAGNTTALGTGSPKLELSSSTYVPFGSIDPSTWTYYGSFSGTLTGTGAYAGGVIEVENYGPNFQVGEGANGKDADPGASGWFEYDVTSAPTSGSWSNHGEGDVNIDFVECDPDPDPDPCVTHTLGEAGEWNVFVFEDYVGGVDVQGAAAAGGLLDMENFSVGASVAGTVLVADELSLIRGTVWGNALYDSTASIHSSVTITGGSLINGSPVDWAAEQTALEDLSLALAMLAPTGTTTVRSWGGIVLTGTEADLNVFTLSGADLNAAVQFDIAAPAGSTVVVNIDGATDGMSNFATTLTGTDQHHVLYNFYQATTVTMSSVAVRGSLLAPYADVDFSNGDFNGSIIANSLSGSAEGHWYEFRGEFEVCEDDDGFPDGIEF
jgi:choice-of-anchor A domain-containing protein